MGVEIVTDRLRIGELTLADAPAFFNYRSLEDDVVFGLLRSEWLARAPREG
jgi:hypothetical protein